MSAWLARRRKKTRRSKGESKLRSVTVNGEQARLSRTLDTEEDIRMMFKMGRTLREKDVFVFPQPCEGGRQDVSYIPADDIALITIENLPADYPMEAPSEDEA